MTAYQITFPNQQTILLPAATVAAIAQSAAKYDAPLWAYRAEKVLKLGAHQWIYPSGPDAAQTLFAAYPHGQLCTAWKLFNRGWLAHAEAYFVDAQSYPNQPRHLGRDVIPLVDEDQDSAQIGWVQIQQYTPMADNFAVFVQFLLLDSFAARPLSKEYA